MVQACSLPENRELHHEFTKSASAGSEKMLFFKSRSKNGGVKLREAWPAGTVQVKAVINAIGAARYEAKLENA